MKKTPKQHGQEETAIFSSLSQHFILMRPERGKYQTRCPSSYSEVVTPAASLAVNIFSDVSQIQHPSHPHLPGQVGGRQESFLCVKEGRKINQSGVVVNFYSSSKFKKQSFGQGEICWLAGCQFSGRMPNSEEEHEHMTASEYLHLYTVLKD